MFRFLSKSDDSVVNVDFFTLKKKDPSQGLLSNFGDSTLIVEEIENSIMWEIESWNCTKATAYECRVVKIFKCEGGYDVN